MVTLVVQLIAVLTVLLAALLAFASPVVLRGFWRWCD
jgi:hypothetical protein